MRGQPDCRTVYAARGVRSTLIAPHRPIEGSFRLRNRCYLSGANTNGQAPRHRDRVEASGCAALLLPAVAIGHRTRIRLLFDARPGTLGPLRFAIDACK